MTRRLLALLLILCCLPLSGSCELPAPETLATISQLDPRFDGEEYTYFDLPFRSSSCAPASVVNALVAALGITDPETAAGLTLDLLNLTTSGGNSKTMNFQLLSRLAEDPAPLQKYKTLHRVLSDWGGQAVYSGRALSQADIAAAVAAHPGQSLLLLGSSRDENRWKTLYYMADWLYRNGHGDASISLAVLGTGTRDTDGAFRFGSSGHNVTLYFPIRPFIEEGTVYLLDSLPRALPGEEYDLVNPRAVYTRCYDFHPSNIEKYKFKNFLSRCQLERVTTTIVRMSPSPALLEDMKAAQTLEERASLCRYYLLLTYFTSDGKTIIHIPAD